MHVHILGLGPIGTLVAHHIRRTLRPPHIVSLIHKNQERADKAENVLGNRILAEYSGVAVPSTGFWHEAFIPSHPQTPEQRRETFREHRNRAKIQSLIVCLKTHQTLPAVGSLYNRITPHTTIVLLQNGMGMMELLNRELFTKPEYRPNFVLATNTHGAWSKGYMHSVHAGIGEINLGIFPPEYNPGKDGEKVDFERSWEKKNELSLDDIAPNPNIVQERVKSSGKEEVNLEAEDRMRRFKSLRATIEMLTRLKSLNVSWRPMRQVNTLMQRKVAINSVINPLTTIMNCPNGALFHHREAAQIAMKLCNEATTVFYQQHRREMKRAKFHGENIGYRPFPRELLAHALLYEVKRVARITGSNYSSMLMDARKGNDTEIRSMNGYLVGIGDKCGLPMHANKMMVDLVGLRTRIPLISSTDSLSL
ncbi:ketopantoate reductase PanE/ApbA C terminal-domain-containing protein [Irpex rosettiformis]|uniref:Ketopantoate reductase PanE/ApbA C terminal-domain-containing protein n=1 Tax=Irpex rosettiformis TaxID=378272 RepID=A0ACB8UJ43_9APHY|nr:ketopantoate reductase PanE/ApbA C terminal-domain-containing protein [Irpex rosettiformis]